MRGESGEFPTLSDDAQRAGLGDSLRQVGLDDQQAAFLESLLFKIGMATGAVLMSHGQRMKSPNDFSAHLKSDGLGGHWLDLSGAFKGDQEGALLGARNWADFVGELEGVGQIDYVRLRGSDGTDELAFGDDGQELGREDV